MAASFPSSIKSFGSDAVNGDYIEASHVNDLRAEVVAVETALGANLANTLSASAFTAKGDLLTATAAGVLSALGVGTNGQVLTADSTVAKGIAWKSVSSSPRVTTITSSNAPVANADTTDIYTITALATDSIVGQPTGTLVDGQRLMYRIKDNGTSRAIGFWAGFRPIVKALPTTTIAGKWLYLGFMYNSIDSCWDFVAIAQAV